MRVLRCGDRAALVEVDDLAAVLRLYNALRHDPPEGVTQLVPAARTVLVGFDPDSVGFERLADRLAERRDCGPAAAGGAAPATASPAVEVPDVEVPVRYDGQDLAEVAELTGLSEREVVARHTGGTHTVGFCGFAPGFAYIHGLDPALRVRRRDTPRTRVPAGAVALADGFTGVYPRESPGGWQIIGRTRLRVWDPDRDPPAVLAPGTRIRFVAVRR